MADLELTELHGSLTDRALTSMNFLNEVSHHYPDAISLAAGRPTEEFFALEDLHRYLDLYADHLRSKGYDEPAVRRAIFQYGRTKGIIHDLVARNLAVDEDIHVDPEAIVVTVGCQVVDDPLGPSVLEDRPSYRWFAIPLGSQVIGVQVEVAVQILEREELLGRATGG